MVHCTLRRESCSSHWPLHAPARFTWGQAATLAGLKPSGGHYNAGRKQLRDLGLIEEATDLVTASPTGLHTAGEVPPAPSTPAERLALWCERLPSPAPEDTAQPRRPRRTLHGNRRSSLSSSARRSNWRPLEQRPCHAAEQWAGRGQWQASAGKRVVPLTAAQLHLRPPRRCPHCKATLETPKTPQNPKAKLQPYTLAGCRRCLTLEMLDPTLRPTLGDMLLDEDTWNTATNSSPEMKAWVDEIQTTARLQAAAEISADCTAARAWAATRGQPPPLGHRDTWPVRPQLRPENRLQHRTATNSRPRPDGSSTNGDNTPANGSRLCGAAEK